MQFVQIKGLSFGFAKLLPLSSRLTLVHPENERSAKVGGRPFDESRSFKVMQCSIQAVAKLVSISHQWWKKSVLRELGKLRWKGILAKGLWRLCYCTIPHPFGVGSFSQSWRQWNFECSMLGLPKIRRPQVRGRFEGEIHRIYIEPKTKQRGRCFFPELHSIHILRLHLHPRWTQPQESQRAKLRQTSHMLRGTPEAASLRARERPDLWVVWMNWII